MALKKTEGVPLYVQIRRALRQDMLDHILEPGQRLPSEDDLAAKFGVSRMTVRQGISELIEEGLLYRRHGVGTFVAYPHLERDHTHLTSFMESARQEGLDVSVRVLALEVLPAKPRIARQLAIEEGELVIRVKTLRIVDGTPVTLHDAFIPYALIPELLTESLATRHIWDILEDHGLRVKRAIQSLEAREADEDIACLLEMDDGAPVLFKERTVYLDNGKPVEFTYCYNRGDRYRLTISLDR